MSIVVYKGLYRYDCILVRAETALATFERSLEIVWDVLKRWFDNMYISNVTILSRTKNEGFYGVSSLEPYKHCGIDGNAKKVSFTGAKTYVFEHMEKTKPLHVSTRTTATYKILVTEELRLSCACFLKLASNCVTGR